MTEDGSTFDEITRAADGLLVGGDLTTSGTEFGSPRSSRKITSGQFSRASQTETG